MSETETTTRTADPGQDLRRSLGFRDLVVYGLLFIAPMAPVGVFGALDAKSHGAVALVHVVATVAMAFTAFSYAQMVRVVPRAGPVYAYARLEAAALHGPAGMSAAATTLGAWLSTRPPKLPCPSARSPG